MSTLNIRVQPARPIDVQLHAIGVAQRSNKKRRRVEPDGRVVRVGDLKHGRDNAGFSRVRPENIKAQSERPLLVPVAPDDRAGPFLELVDLELLLIPFRKPRALRDRRRGWLRLGRVGEDLKVCEAGVKCRRLAVLVSRLHGAENIHEAGGEVNTNYCVTSQGSGWGEAGVALSKVNTPAT